MNDDDDSLDDQAKEIDALATELGAWVGAKAPRHAVSMPFALARILYEVVAHDGGDTGDCLALVRAAKAGMKLRNGTACREKGLDDEPCEACVLNNGAGCESVACACRCHGG